MTTTITSSSLRIDYKIMLHSRLIFATPNDK